MVSNHGTGAGYVRNFSAHPSVRLQIRRRWHTGTAHLVPDDDPRQRLRRLPFFNSCMVRLLGTQLTTVRIDLKDEPAPAGDKASTPGETRS
jgi:hypothetical protein